MKSISNFRSNCPLCKKKILPIQIVKLNKIFHAKEAFIFRCPSCDIAWTSPDPSVDKYYETNYEYVSQISKSERGYRYFALYFVDKIKRMSVPGSRFLDIGCGMGYLVEALSEKGFYSEGIDLNSLAVKAAKQRGLNVSNKTVDDLIEEGSKFEIVLMSHVLEHIDDPLSMIKKVRHIVKPKGKLILAQTNYHGLFPRIFPQLWYGWQPLEHFWHFTPESLSRILKLCNFEIKTIIPGSLHHGFKLSINPKILIGQNIISATARFCNIIGEKESYILIANTI